MDKIRLVNSEWATEIHQAANVARESDIRIVCPFIQAGPLGELLGSKRRRSIQVITRFSMRDWHSGVNDMEALEILLEHDAEIRGVFGVHSKLYLFGDIAIVGSTNLTRSALKSNHELGLIIKEATLVSRCREHFSRAWTLAGPSLDAARLQEWKMELKALRRALPPVGPLPVFKDYGARVPHLTDGAAEPSNVPATERDAIVKFFGTTHDRWTRDQSVIQELERSGCHWACGYPRERRPRGMRTGTPVFMGRLVKEPHDIVIFGRAIGIEYDEDRDVANVEEIRATPWRAEWPHYIRVRDAQFVAGTLQNGVSLNGLMTDLGADCFASTQENRRRGAGNTDPRLAYQQQPAVRLSARGYQDLNLRLNAAFSKHGQLSQDLVEAVGRPARSQWLSASGRRVLNLLLHALATGRINPGDPKSYFRYGEMLEALGIAPKGGRQNGRQLRTNGLDDLDEWTRRYRFPAIAGLIVTLHNGRLRPGDGFFRPYTGALDLAWWDLEMRRAAAFDWNGLVS
jgi:hypothetical protein